MTAILAIVCCGMLVSGCSNEPESSDFQTVAYSGHSYVVYDGGDYDSGVVHNPDCDCFSANKPVASNAQYEKP